MQQPSDFRTGFKVNALTTFKYSFLLLILHRSRCLYCLSIAALKKYSNAYWLKAMIIIYCFPWFLWIMNFKSGSTDGCGSRSHEVLVRHQDHSHLKAEWLTCTAASWGRASVPSTWATSQGSLGALKATNAVHWVPLLDWLPLPPWEPGHGRYSRPGLAWMDSVWPLPFSLPA